MKCTTDKPKLKAKRSLNTKQNGVDTKLDSLMLIDFVGPDQS